MNKQRFERTTFLFTLLLFCVTPVCYAFSCFMCFEQYYFELCNIRLLSTIHVLNAKTKFHMKFFRRMHTLSDFGRCSCSFEKHKQIEITI